MSIEDWHVQEFMALPMYPFVAFLFKNCELNYCIFSKVREGFKEKVNLKIQNII